MLIAPDSCLRRNDGSNVVNGRAARQDPGSCFRRNDICRAALLSPPSKRHPRASGDLSCHYRIIEVEGEGKGEGEGERKDEIGIRPSFRKSSSN